MPVLESGRTHSFCGFCPNLSRGRTHPFGGPCRAQSNCGWSGERWGTGLTEDRDRVVSTAVEVWEPQGGEASLLVLPGHQGVEVGIRRCPSPGGASCVRLPEAIAAEFKFLGDDAPIEHIGLGAIVDVSATVRHDEGGAPGHVGEHRRAMIRVEASCASYPSGSCPPQAVRIYRTDQSLGGQRRR